MYTHTHTHTHAPHAHIHTHTHTHTHTHVHTHTHIHVGMDGFVRLFNCSDGAMQGCFDAGHLDAKPGIDGTYARVPVLNMATDPQQNVLATSGDQGFIRTFNLSAVTDEVVICIYKHICMNICIPLYRYTYIRTYVYICINIYIYITYISMYIYIHINIHTCIYTNWLICTYINTYIYIYI